MLVPSSSVPDILNAAFARMAQESSVWAVALTALQQSSGSLLKIGEDTIQFSALIHLLDSHPASQQFPSSVAGAIREAALQLATLSAHNVCLETGSSTRVTNPTGDQHCEPSSEPLRHKIGPGHVLLRCAPFHEGLFIPEATQVPRTKEHGFKPGATAHSVEWILGEVRSEHQEAQSMVCWLIERGKHHFTQDQLVHAKRYCLRAASSLEEQGSAASSDEAVQVLVELARVFRRASQPEASKLALQTAQAVVAERMGVQEALSLVLSSRVPCSHPNRLSPAPQYIVVPNPTLHKPAQTSLQLVSGNDAKWHSSQGEGWHSMSPDWQPVRLPRRCEAVRPRRVCRDPEAKGSVQGVPRRHLTAGSRPHRRKQTLT